MNNRRLAYYPSLLYASLLVVIWLTSWLISVFQLLSGSASTVVSLVSIEGVRWALLSATDSLNAAPWGVLMMLLFVSGLVAGSGMHEPIARFFKGRKATENEVSSLLFALVVLMVYCIILFAFTFFPWKALLGVTGDLMNSPIVHGWILVLLIAALAVSFVYGFLYGNYRTLSDIVSSAGVYMGKFTPALLASLPATGIIPCMQYTGLDQLLGMSDACVDLSGYILYLLPFVYISYLEILGKK